jgi:hypothetical protein
MFFDSDDPARLLSRRDKRANVERLDRRNAQHPARHPNSSQHLGRPQSLRQYPARRRERDTLKSTRTLSHRSNPPDPENFSRPRRRRRSGLV